MTDPRQPGPRASISDDPGLRDRARQMHATGVSWARMRADLGVFNGTLAKLLGPPGTPARSSTHVRDWSEQVGMPISRFSRTTLKRHNPSPRRHHLGDAYFGCLYISVTRSAREFRRAHGYLRESRPTPRSLP